MAVDGTILLETAWSCNWVGVSWDLLHALVGSVGLVPCGERLDGGWILGGSVVAVAHGDQPEMGMAIGRAVDFEIRKISGMMDLASGICCMILVVGLERNSTGCWVLSMSRGGTPGDPPESRPGEQ